jgi:uncharacterized protein YcnI
MRRTITTGLVIAGTVVLVAGPAAAHTEWEPESAAPGSVAELTLFVEDEQPDAGTNKVELQFPEAITVVALPEVPGWAATVVGGQVGGPGTGVTWEGGPDPDDVTLPITLGPLPAEPGRLQFKVVQTYDNGTVDRWIDEWPDGAPEPESPGPVLELVPGAAGSIPTATTAPPATEAPATTTPSTSATDESAADETDDEDSGIPAVVWVVVALAVVAAVAGGAYLYQRRRHGTADES